MRRFIAITTVAVFSIGTLVGQLAAVSRPAGQLAGPKPPLGKTGAAGKPAFQGHPIGSVGRDVIVGDLSEVFNWGTMGGVNAYSVGTTSCNIGTVPLAWEEPTPLHPVIPQNLYRLKTVDGSSRFEQLGMSWCKHGFCALQETLCGPCIPFGIGCEDHLGVGCSDPYSGFLNGVQSNLGPRYQINATTGVFPFPPATYGMSGGFFDKRIRILQSDLNPALNPGALYFCEGQYVHQEDAADGNGANNASWRRFTVGTLSGAGYALNVSSSTVRMQPAVYGWAASDPAASISTVDVPGDGRFVLGYKAQDLGGGVTHYEYAVYNINSHRSGGSFSVPIPNGVVITNVGFRDVDYHSQTMPGIPASAVIDNVDWTATIGGGQLKWSTTTHTPAVDGTANALRFATLYNFRFDASRPAAPQGATATLGLFRPGTPTSVTLAAAGPGAPTCIADIDSTGAVDGLDIAGILAQWTGAASYSPCPPTRRADLNNDCKVNGIDLGMLLGGWGACP